MFLYVDDLITIMFAAKTELKNAEKVKQFLLKKYLLSPDYLVVKEMGFIYFPLNTTKTKKIGVPNTVIVNTKFLFPQKAKPVSVEELLQGKLTPKETEILPKSQEVIGTILILEIPEELLKKERVIAEAYLQAHKHLTTVVKKDQIHSGEYRLRKVKVLAGKNTKESIHHENGVDLKIHLEQTYYSARSSNERLRIAKQVKRGEEVMVMFSGAGPYPLVIARNSPAKMVYGVEINPLAHHLAIESIALNHLEKKVFIFNGDVREVLPKLKKKYDRIIMPLPKTGEEFLDVALKYAKPKAMIHLYAFLAEEDTKKEAQRIKKRCATLKYPLQSARTVLCGQFSPRIHRVCFDLKMK